MKKNLSPFLLPLFSFLFFLSACATTPTARLSCLPDAIVMDDAVKVQARFAPYRWSRVLLVRCVGWAHALCVYEYAGRIMCYDNERGSWTLTRDLEKKSSPTDLALYWLGDTRLNNSILSAEFLEQ